MAENRWAVKVMWQLDDWLYVTEDTGKCDWNLRPVLFDTKDEAEQFADTWRLAGAEGNVKVVEYNEDQTSK